MKTVKLIALDLDGTLIRENQRVSLKDRRAIARAQSAGIPVMIATGRLYPSTCGWLSGLGIRTPAICCNGADIREGAVSTYTSSIDSAQLGNVYRAMDPYGAQRYVYCKDRIYCTREDYNEILFNKWGKKVVADGLVVYCSGLEEILQAVGNEAIKLVVLTRDESRHTEIFNKTGLFDYFDMVMGETLHFEFTRRGTNKGEALARIANKMGIEMQNVLAVGDSMNDYEMIKAAGIGVAMGNAMSEVKKIADEITLPVWENGVACAVSRYVFGEEETGQVVLNAE